jgi:glycine/D-amino acid oxidase-like deaminating enzyme
LTIRENKLPNRKFNAIVVGGGIFGCTTAYLLKQAGKKVCLLEARKIGSGTTSFSTAKLTSQQGLLYTQLATKHGQEHARLYYEMNNNAIDFVEKLNFDCDFARRSHTTWTNVPGNVKQVHLENDICHDIGIDSKLVTADEMIKELPKSIRVLLGVRFENQAQFNPHKYCLELCKMIEGDGSKVFEDSRVISVINEDVHTVVANDIKLACDVLVLATHLPIMDRSLHFAVMEPSRTLCSAFKVRPGSHNMVNMSINAEKPTRSMRMAGETLIVCGQGYPNGEKTDTDKEYEILEVWAKEHFEVEEVICRWSAMDYMTGDHIPYVGYLYRGSNSIFTATGFSKWGLTNGIAAAHIVNDLIAGVPNRYQEMVDARRWDLFHQWQGLMLENVHTAKHFVADKIKHLLVPTLTNQLEIGDGRIVKVQGKTVGAYRDAEGYHFVKPVCTHLGCDLVFNRGDKGMCD